MIELLSRRGMNQQMKKVIITEGSCSHDCAYYGKLFKESVERVNAF